MPYRYARVKNASGAAVANYLPENYSVVAEDENTVIIRGIDDAGWTLDGYVIPRLASGLIWAEECAYPLTLAEYDRQREEGYTV